MYPLSIYSTSSPSGAQRPAVDRIELFYPGYPGSLTSLDASDGPLCDQWARESCEAAPQQYSDGQRPWRKPLNFHAADGCDDCSGQSEVASVKELFPVRGGYRC
jgi:hypothetical protein